MIHLAAAIRDEPHARVEELNGLATARLLRAAERAGVEQFVFFSALGASEFQRTRFFRAKALAEKAVADSPARDHDLRAVDRLRPAGPLGAAHEAAGAPAGHCRSRVPGTARFEPIWAHDVARCVVTSLERKAEKARYELAGPQVLTYDEIALAVARASGRQRPLVHVPLGLVHLTLVTLRRLFGEAVFATWEEAELMEVPMVSERGTADAEALGVDTAAGRGGARHLAGWTLSGAGRAAARPVPAAAADPPPSTASPAGRAARGRSRDRRPKGAARTRARIARRSPFSRPARPRPPPRSATRTGGTAPWRR